MSCHSVRNSKCVEINFTEGIQTGHPLQIKEISCLSLLRRDLDQVMEHGTAFLVL